MLSFDDAQKAIRMQQAVPVGRYRHFKGAEYVVIGVARHSETEEELVVYHALASPTLLWVRPVHLFTDTVTRNGVQKPRFSPIDRDR